MMLPTELVDLIAKNGQKDVAHDKRIAAERAAVDRSQAAYEERKAAALPAAEEVFAWADGPVGTELRLLMAFHGLHVLPLNDSGAVGLTSEKGTLWANNFGRWMTARRGTVRTVEDFVKIAGIEQVRRLLAEIHDGSVLDNAREALRKLSSP